MSLVAGLIYYAYEEQTHHEMQAAQTRAATQSQGVRYATRLTGVPLDGPES
jgi:hypothetical protein